MTEDEMAGWHHRLDGHDRVPEAPAVVDFAHEVDDGGAEGVVHGAVQLWHHRLNGHEFG